MLKKKQLIVTIVLATIFIIILLSWNLFRDNHLPIIATSLDVTATVTMNGDKSVSDSLLEMQFKWETGPNWTPLERHPVIFVHLQDEDGERLCQDDHVPTPPLDEWKANHVYQYTRHMYVPITLIKKKVSLLIGFYDQSEPDEYYAIDGLKKFNRYHRYLAKEFLLAPSDLEYSEALIKYTRGWYDPELDSRGNVMWRWMKRHGECRLVNPRKDALLFFDIWIPNEHLSKPAEMSVKLAGKPLEFTVNNRDDIQKIIEIPADRMGDEDYIVLEFETDQTFIPAQEGDSVDVRELGIMVKKILIRSK